MKKTLLRAGLLSIGSLSMLSGNTVLCRSINAKSITNTQKKEEVERELEEVNKEMELLTKAKEIVNVSDNQLGKDIIFELNLDDIKVNIENNIDQNHDEIEYLESKINEYERELKIYSVVEDFSKVYELKSDVILNKLIDLTNNFENWDSKIVIEDKEYDTMEEAILRTIRSIDKKPKNYNLTKEEIRSDENYEPDMILEDIVKKYCDILSANPIVPVSIMVNECGSEINSANFRVNNNPAGLGPHIKYRNIEHGICEFIFVLKGYGLKSDSTISYIDTTKYCGSDSETYWRKCVKSYYKHIDSDYYYYYNHHGSKRKVKKK